MKRDRWKRQLEEHPDRPQGRQHRQFEVLVALADQVNGNTGEGAVSVAQLAKTAGASDRTAKRALAWARTAGLLEQTSRGRRRGDGTTSASAWRLAGKPEPQGANPKPQGVNSGPQGASTAKTPRTRPSTARPRSRGTPTPAPAREVLADHAWCRDCGFELDPHIAAAGFVVHAGCADPLDTPLRSQA